MWRYWLYLVKLFQRLRVIDTQKAYMSMLVPGVGETLTHWACFSSST